MFDRPRRVYAILIPLALVLFAGSAIGSHETPHGAHPVRYYVSAICWVGFGVAVLAIVGFTLALGARRLRRRPS